MSAVIKRNYASPSLLCLAAAVIHSGSNCAQAQTQAQAQPQSQEEIVLDEVDITGRALPGAVLGDIPPENTLTQRDIRAYGVGTVSELLSEITSQTTSGQSRDGAGPVVLVNGRRISGVNEVGDLPTEAVLRLDILPEEVALKYGYSSDQKVVNVILRRRFAAVTGEGQAGASIDGGNERARANAALTRIRDNQRLNVAGTVQLQGDITEAQRDIVPANDDPAGDTAYRTLQPERQGYSANAVYAAPLTSAISASSNLGASHSISRGLNGLSELEPAEPLDRTTTSTTLRLGSALNMDLKDSWRMSLVGSYDHSDSRTETERSSDVETGGVSRQVARSKADSGEASVLASRKLFALPAGSLLLSLQGGVQVSQTRTESDTGMEDAQSLSRSSGNARASLDLPITKRAGWGGAIGSLTANLNAATTRVSDFHTLTTSGYGLNWSPVAALSLIAAVSEDRRAPSAEQLVNPTVTNDGVSVYDYLTGQSVLVTSTSGGNPLLRADDRRTFKLGGTLKPFASQNFTVTANYSESRTRNAIQSLSGISESLEAAFPERYKRDEDGVLIAIDTRAVNIASQDRSSLRWGFNLTKVLREPQRPQFGNRPRLPPGFEPPEGFRGRMSQGEEGATPASPAASQLGQSPAQPGGTDATPAGEQPATGTPDQTLDEALVTGRREAGEGMPFGERGFRGRPGGFPPDGFPPDGFPPPGGFPGGGGPGGPGGFGRGGPGGPGGPGGFGGGNGAQLQLSVFHTWLFRNETTLREGLGSIDLLNGGSTGGTPPARHQIQLNGGVTDNGIGIRLTGQWRSAGRTADSNGVTGDLHFAALGTVDLRMFADVAQRLTTQRWARGLRVTLTVQNLLNDRQKVKNDAGETPQAYQPGYLDATGRTALLTVRLIR